MKRAPDLEGETLLSRKQLGARWGCSTMTIKRRERGGQLPSLRFSQRLVRYRMSDVLAYEELAATGSRMR